MLVRCLYASRAGEPTTDAMLDDILHRSRRNNQRSEITGLLCLANGVFAQVIEGGRTEVSALMGRVFADRRHSGIEILAFEEIEQRRFSNWSMGQVNFGGINPGLLLKYSERAVFNPFACAGATTMALLLEIAETGAVAHRTASVVAATETGADA